MKQDPSKIIVANWNMNGDFDFAVHYFKHLCESVLDENLKIIVCPPIQFINIGYRFVIESESEQICLGAQNVSHLSDNLSTGEISASMLEECGAKVVLLGNCSRRLLNEESDKMINDKIKLLQSSSISPILCVSSVNQNDNFCAVKEIIEQQIIGALNGIKHIEYLLIAYEQNTNNDNKQQDLSELEEISIFTKEVAKKACKIDNLKVLFSGYINGANINSLLLNDNIDGLIVNEYSLKMHEFCESLEHIHIEG